MQVNHLNSNYNTPNFQAIRSVKCEGLYKKYPELGQRLVETFQKSKEAMDFCKKYDSDIVFYAHKSGIDAVESSVHIFYDNPAVSKFKKLLKFLNLTDSCEDRINLSSSAREFDLHKSLQKATDSLVKIISPFNESTNRGGGLLAFHMQIADGSIEKTLAEKTAKRLKKEAEAAEQIARRTKLQDDTSSLEDAIQRLINNGK